MIDVSQLEDFARRCEAARADLKPYAGKTLEQIGEEFLDIVQAEIESAGNIDTTALQTSFKRGEAGNIFQLDMGGLTLTVGTSICYANLVNKGHKQQPGRFVPGVWEGKHFRYIKGAKTGMVLKADKVKGSKFFDKSVKTLESMFPTLARKSFEQFFARYFS